MLAIKFSLILSLLTIRCNSHEIPMPINRHFVPGVEFVWVISDSECTNRLTLLVNQRISAPGQCVVITASFFHGLSDQFEGGALSLGNQPPASTVVSDRTFSSCNGGQAGGAMIVKSADFMISRSCATACRAGIGAFMLLALSLNRNISMCEGWDFPQGNSVIEQEKKDVAALSLQSTNLSNCLGTTNAEHAIVQMDNGVTTFRCQYLCLFRCRGRMPGVSCGGLSSGDEIQRIVQCNFFNNSFTVGVVATRGFTMDVMKCVFMHNDGGPDITRTGSDDEFEIHIEGCIFSRDAASSESDEFVRTDCEWGTVTDFLSVALLGRGECTFTPSNLFSASTAFSSARFGATCRFTGSLEVHAADSSPRDARDAGDAVGRFPMRRERPPVR
jgi:hypothetical protein